VKHKVVVSVEDIFPHPYLFSTFWVFIFIPGKKTSVNTNRGFGPFTSLSNEK
jgi:hypothetical protein